MSDESKREKSAVYTVCVRLAILHQVRDFFKAYDELVLQPKMALCTIAANSKFFLKIIIRHCTAGEPQTWLRHFETFNNGFCNANERKNRPVISLTKYFFLVCQSVTGEPILYRGI